MALQKIVGSTAFAQSISPTNNPARRVAQNKASLFSNLAKGSDAVANGIVASSLKANKQSLNLALALIRSRLNNESTIPNMLRNNAKNPEAARFNLETPRKQLFRIFQQDIQASIGQKASS